MAQIDKTYNQLLNAVLDGYKYRTENRPDSEMTQITSVNFEHDLLEFPVITTKKLYWKGVVGELIWFLRGESNIKFLKDRGISIWDKDADNFSEDGNVGRNYGVQWRLWKGTNDEGYGTVDQIDNLIINLRKINPIDRKHIVTAWNPAELDQTALPPCHWSFEVLPRPLTYQQKIMQSGKDIDYMNSLWDSAFMKKDDKAKKLLNDELEGIPDYGFTLKWHQRSVDTFLGLPFNIASYALLSKIIGLLTNLVPLSIIGDLSNVHIYENHIDAVNKQISNNTGTFKAPEFEFSDKVLESAKDLRNNKIHFEEFISKLEIDDFKLIDYQSFGKISAKMIAPIK